jgi:hypothetical protein
MPGCLFVPKNGESQELTQENWHQEFTASAGQEEKGQLRIESADITGQAAAVKVVDILRARIIFSPHKLLQGWKIANKIFTFEKHTTVAAERRPIRHRDW